MHIMVVVDANVIFAASILGELRNQDPIKFPEQKGAKQARKLFYMLEKNHEDVMGILVPTVRGEVVCGRILQAAYDMWDFGNHLNKATRAGKKGILDRLVRMLNNIGIMREGFLSVLHEMDLERNDLETNRESVVSMSNDLRSRYDSATDAEREKLEQLEKFMDHPNDSDEQILAEAITIKKRQTPPLLLIASLDTGFFTPCPRKDESNVNRSDEVTREIRERFDIQCDYPHIIQKIVEEHKHRD